MKSERKMKSRRKRKGCLIAIGIFVLFYLFVAVPPPWYKLKCEDFEGGDITFHFLRTEANKERGTAYCHLPDSFIHSTVFSNWVGHALDFSVSDMNSWHPGLFMLSTKDGKKPRCADAAFQGPITILNINSGIWGLLDCGQYVHIANKYDLELIQAVKHMVETNGVKVYTWNQWHSLEDDFESGGEEDFEAGEEDE